MRFPDIMLYFVVVVVVVVAFETATSTSSKSRSILGDRFVDDDLFFLLIQLY